MVNYVFRLLSASESQKTHMLLEFEHKKRNFNALDEIQANPQCEFI